MIQTSFASAVLNARIVITFYCHKAERDFVDDVEHDKTVRNRQSDFVLSTKLP